MKYLEISRDPMLSCRFIKNYRIKATNVSQKNTTAQQSAAIPTIFTLRHAAIIPAIKARIPAIGI